MSKISEAILTIEDLYANAKIEFDFWHDKIMCKGIYSEDNAITAAQYYGEMLGYAEVNYRLLGDEGLKNLIDEIDPKFFKSDYNEIGS